MARKWYDAEVLSIKDLSPTTKSFQVKILEDEIFNFIPGQFVTMDLPIGEKRLERWRSYSIASVPNTENTLEFCIVRTDPGHASKYLFEEVEKGVKLKFKGPEGNFCLPASQNKNIIMICTGTGIAPFRSMIQSSLANKDQHFNIDLIFGTRYKTGILYFEELEELQKEHKNFNYHIALSRELLGGYQGYVHEIYQQKYTTKDDNNLFYLCGWQNMVDEATKNLLNLGYQTSQIITELYG